MSIHYTLTASHPEAHVFSIVLTIDKPDPEGQQLSLPTWIPGSYMIRDFSKNITSIRASSNDVSIELKKIDKACWTAPKGLEVLRIEYEIYAWDLSVRTAHLDTLHGFFNGTSVFLCVAGQADQPCTVTLNPPQFAELNSDLTAEPWKVATSLGQVSVDANGFGDYHATDYDDLIDHPVEMGTFERVTFEACGVPHDLVLTGQYTTDTDRICHDLKRICEYQIRFFGEPAPMDHYVFLVMVVGDGYGGLEHRASTSLLIQREHLPVPDSKEISDEYLEFLGLCSHEYFHTWNVKRIKPAQFVPYQLEQESHTTLLWAFEGITSYYDDLILVNCGLIDHEKYLTLLGRTITRVHRGAGRLKQSVAESSFDAWTKFYKQDENAPNAIVSYYAKGALVALALDLTIREKTGGKKNLQHLMQNLWQQWLNDGAGVSEDAFEREAIALCGEESREDFHVFFQHAVYGTEDIALDKLLKSVGVALHWRARESQDDRGGVPATESVLTPPLTLGLRAVSGNTGLKITHVYDAGPAQKAGLSAGDTLIALDRLACSSNSLANILARCRAGGELTVHAFRRDELLTLAIIPEVAATDTAYLTIEDKTRVASWLEQVDIALS